MLRAPRPDTGRPAARCAGVQDGRPVNQALVLDEDDIEVPAAQRGQRHGLTGFVHPHLYAGRSLLERSDCRHDQTSHHRGVRPDVRRATEPAGHGVDVVGGIGQHLGETATVRRETLPGRRQPQRSLTSAVKAVDQDKTSLAFEPGEVLRDAGGSQVEVTGRGTDPAGRGHRLQDQQPVRGEVHAVRLYAEVSKSYFSLPTLAGRIGAMDLIDLIGFAGAIFVLAAFALSNSRSVGVTPKTLAVMNLGAGAALALNGLVHQAWPSVVVNTVWSVIAAVALGRAAVPRSERKRPRMRWATPLPSTAGRLRASGDRGPYPGAALIELEHDGRGRDDSRVVRGGQDRTAGRRLFCQHPDDLLDRRLVLL